MGWGNTSQVKERDNLFWQRILKSTQETPAVLENQRARYLPRQLQLPKIEGSLLCLNSTSWATYPLWDPLWWLRPKELLYCSLILGQLTIFVRTWEFPHEMKSYYIAQICLQQAMLQHWMLQHLKFLSIPYACFQYFQILQKNSSTTVEIKL